MAGACLLSDGQPLSLGGRDPTGNLVAGMRWFLGTYTARFNRRHKLFGHLFSGRYKSLVVDGSGDGYLKSLCDYVHLNPVRAKLLPAGQRLAEYRWSSWPGICSGRETMAVAAVDRLLGNGGSERTTPPVVGDWSKAWSSASSRTDPGERDWGDCGVAGAGAAGIPGGVAGADWAATRTAAPREELKESDQQKAERLVGRWCGRLAGRKGSWRTGAKGRRGRRGWRRGCGPRRR